MIHCQLCGKHNATIYFKGIVNDQTIKLHLCEGCAKKKGMVFPFGKSAFSLGDMVASLSAVTGLGGALGTAVCKTCGLSYAEFQQTSQFGCSQCYSTFENLVGPLLKRIHGSSQHLGKTVRRTVRTAASVQELTRLKLDLHEAIRSENYERAAALRDQIRTLEQALTSRPGKK